MTEPRVTHSELCVIHLLIFLYLRCQIMIMTNDSDNDSVITTRLSGRLAYVSVRQESLSRRHQINALI